MKLFISWSGEPSHKIACVLRAWFPNVLDYIKPWVSSEDIEKGSRWGLDLSKELDSTFYGILCILPDNINEPWLVFKAGALSKTLKRSRVSPFLFGLNTRKLEGPLSMFQATVFEKEDVWKLIKSINNQSQDYKIATDIIKKKFSPNWPKLTKLIEPIINEISVSSELIIRASTSQLSKELNLTKDHIEILKVFADSKKRDIEVADIKKVLGWHKVKIEYLLDILTEKELLDKSDVDLNEFEPDWSLSNKGKAFLVENNIL